MKIYDNEISVKFFTSPYYRCLGPILDALGWKGDDKALIDALPYNVKNFTIRPFIETLSNLMFKPFYLGTSLKKIKENHLPILFIDKNNKIKIFIKKFNEEYLYFDGNEGIFHQGKIKSNKCFLLTFEFKEEDEKTLMDNMPNWFMALMLRYRTNFLQIIGLSIFFSVLSLASPLLVMVIYGQISIANVRTDMTLLFFGIIFFIFSISGVTLIRKYLLNFISFRTGNIVSREIIRRLLYLSPSNTDKGNIGSQLSRLKDFDTVKDFISGPGMSSLFDIPFIVIILIAMYFIAGKVVLVPITAIIFFILSAIYFTPLVKDYNSNLSSVNKKKSDFLLETFTNVDAFKYSNISFNWIGKFNKMTNDSLLNSCKSNIINNNINIISNSIVSFAALGTVTLGVLQVINGNMPSSALMATILLMWKVLNPLKTIFTLFSQIDRLKSSVRQLNRFMKLELEEKVGESLVNQRPIKGDINFNQILFRYSPQSHLALINIDFHLNSNNTLLITGHGHSGKSTILKLLLNLYLPTSGRILIDKMNIKQIPPSKLRKSFAYCPQDPSFFSDSILQNFYAVSPFITHEEINKWLDEFSIIDDIEALPDKIYTTINKETKSKYLSPNLLKTLSFIRALIQNKNILIIDGVDVDLDAKSKRVIKQKLIKMKGQKTIIVTAQDLSWANIADNILMINQGRVQNYGTTKRILELHDKKNKQ